jgi:hypothetical protein
MTPSSSSTHNTTTFSGISCPGARSLLADLTSDFETEGKRSVRNCLRSKSLPCPQVTALLQRQDYSYLDQLVPANQILQQEYLPLLSQPPQQQSSMWYMSRVSTILRFTQLLLESKQQQQQQPRPPLGDHNKSSNRPSPSPSPTHTLAPPQLDKLASMLLLQLAKAMVSCPAAASEEDDDEEEEDILTSDASTTYNPQQVVSFCFASMLRLNHYAKTRMVLIPPLWKGLCDLSRNCPSQMLEQALQALSVYLSEGQAQVIRYSQIYVETLQVPIAAPQQAGQAKLMGFLVARVSSLLSTFAKTTDNLFESVAISSVWESFLRLRGAVSAVQVLLIEKQAFQDEHAFLLPYLEIGNKVEKVTAEWILVHGNEASNVVHRSALNSLLQLPLSSNSSSKDDRLADLALSLGRAQLLQRILVDVTTQVTTKFQNDQDVESILSLCEIMILQVLPQCHAPFMSASLTLNTPGPATSRIVSCLISQSLQLLSKSLLLIEASMQEATKRAQLYRLLVRWLAPQRADQCQHPTSRELAISIVYWHILGSNQGVVPLISLLAKLFLDPRTGIHLRQNIGAVMHRLLSSTTTKKQLVSTFLSSELVRRLASNSPIKKRKRSSRQQPLGWKVYAHEDFQTIGSVLSHLSPTLMTADLKTRIGTFCHQKSSLMQGQGLELKALLLYCLQACLRNSDTGSNNQFQQITGGKSIPQLLDMVVSWPTKLLQLETLPTCPSIWSKKRAILAISVLSFGTQSCALGQGRHQIQQLCRLLSLCTSSPFLPLSTNNNNNSDQYFLPVLFQAITLLRTIGKVIPPDCPKSILQVSTRLRIRKVIANV